MKKVGCNGTESVEGMECLITLNVHAALNKNGERPVLTREEREIRK